MRKIVLAVATSALLTAGVGAALIASRDDSAAAQTDFSAAQAGAQDGVHMQKVAAVVAADTNSEIRFRSTPTVPTNNGDSPNEMFSVPGPTDVTVHCITDDANPHRTPEKWYYVTLNGAPYPAVSAYVWGNLVRDAPPVPACTEQIVAAHPRMPGTLTLTRGAAHGKAYWYAITLRGFHPGFEYTVGCYDDHEVHHLNSTEPFRTFSLRTDSAGNAATDTSCFSGEGERHWVEIGPYTSELAEWTVPTPVPTQSAIDPAITVGPSPQPSRPTTPTQLNPPPPTSTPETRIITVQNQVTNGATAMREDTPAYLSTRPAPFCKRDGCAVADTDLGTGATLTAHCHIDGPQMTNGQNNSSIDDGNPGLATSSLWYRATTNSGREGLISEVYIRPGDRGGLGLPVCP